jgi:hypothetical protein
MSRRVSQAPPASVERVRERVRASDRAWFDAHPGAAGRVRPYVPGEAWPAYLPDITHVIVRQIAPGARHKTYVSDREGIRMYAYDLASGRLLGEVGKDG